MMGFYETIDQMITNQKEIDKYYLKKKKEIGCWIKAFAEQLKRLHPEDRDYILEYASNVSITTIGQFYAKVLYMTGIPKAQKDKLKRYISKIEWLPSTATVGKVDGIYISRKIPESPFEKLLKEAFGNEGCVCNGSDDDK